MTRKAGYWYYIDTVAMLQKSGHKIVKKRENTMKVKGLSTYFSKEEMETKLGELERIINGLLDGSLDGFFIFGELTENDTNLHTTGLISPKINKVDLLTALRDCVQSVDEKMIDSDKAEALDTLARNPNVEGYF